MAICSVYFVTVPNHVNHAGMQGRINAYMKIERAQNATRNIAFGLISRIYGILIPFLMRSAMIYFMGIEYLGLNGLFASILQVLNLAELGVSSAMVYSMYKPIAQDDEVTICALMKLYRLYYRVIGIVVAVLGVVLLPFLPRLIHSDLPPDVDLTVLYVLHLSATVFSYWLFAYKNSLFQAHQREDIISKISIVVDTIKYVAQLLVLIFLKDYYIYILIVLLSQILSNIVTAIVAERTYPNYKPKGELPQEEKRAINQRIKDLFTAKIGAVLSLSVDDMVISAFIGLSMVAIYQNYYFIMKAVITIVLIFFSSCTAGVGNSLVTESTEKNYNDFRILAFLTIWVCVICVSCFACLYQPFMEIWVGEEYLLPDLMIALMCSYFFVYIMQIMSCVYKDAAGIWHQDRFRPIITGVLNLSLNILFVQTWGVYAVVISTIISYVFVAMPWIIKNLFDLVFKRSAKEYVAELFKGAGIAAVSGIICYFIGIIIPVNGFGGLLLRLLIALVISNVLIIVLRRRNPMYNPSIAFIDKITRFKITKLLEMIKT